MYAHFAKFVDILRLYSLHKSLIWNILKITHFIKKASYRIFFLHLTAVSEFYFMKHVKEIKGNNSLQHLELKMKGALTSLAIHNGSPPLEELPPKECRK